VTSALEQNTPPQFGAVVINWNNSDDTLACLDSLLANEPRPARVVVVDNASADDSLPRIRDWRARHRFSGIERSDSHPWLTIIESATNLGFAGGSNLGIDHLLRQSAVTHVMLLNNDATLTRSFFADMAETIRRFPDAGILGPTIFETGSGKKVWYAGGVEYSWRALMQHNVTLPTRDDPIETAFVTGCAMIIARHAIEKIGLLAECYFPAYWEDGDISIRARHAGIPVLYVPTAVAYHKIGATVEAADLAVTLASCKNRLRVFFVRRNYHGLTRIVALTYLAVTKPARSLLEALKGHPRIGWAIFSGTLSGFVSRDAHR